MGDAVAVTFRTLGGPPCGAVIASPEALVSELPDGRSLGDARTGALIQVGSAGPCSRPRKSSLYGAQLRSGAGAEIVMLTHGRSLVRDWPPRPMPPSFFTFTGVTPYGVLALLLAMPVVSALVNAGGTAGPRRRCRSAWDGGSGADGIGTDWRS